MSLSRDQNRGVWTSRHTQPSSYEIDDDDDDDDVTF